MLSIAVFLLFVLTNSTSFSMMPVFMRFRFREVFFFERLLLRQRGAHFAAERSEEEHSGAKWRGRGLGQRNTKNYA